MIPIRKLFLFITSFSSLAAFSLQEAETLALQTNPHIKSAEELVEKARQGRLESVSKWLPKLSLLSQYFRTQVPLTLLGLNQPNEFYTQFTVSQTVFALDLIQDLKITSLGVKQFDYLLQAARNDVLFQVRLLYYLVALDHKKISTAKEHIRLLNYLSDKVEYKYQIGEATLYNVNQAKVAAINVTDSYYLAFQHLKTNQDELTKTLGFDPSEPPASYTQEDLPFEAIAALADKVKAAESIFNENRDRKKEAKILKEGFSELENQILERIFPLEEFVKWRQVADSVRPDILLSKTYLQMAHQSVVKSRSDYYPKLQFLFNYGGAPSPYIEQPSTHFNNQEMQWGAGLSLNWNLFDGLGRERRIQRAKAEERAVGFDAKKVIQAAHADVREQLYRMEKAIAKYLTASANLKLANETLKQADSQLDIGYINIYDYMISVDGLIRAQTALDEGKFELLISYYSLLHASGREF